VSVALRALGSVGRPVVSAARWLVEVGGMSAAVASHAMRASTWRPTVRQAFVLAMRDAILGALPATLLLSVLVGLGLLYQALYWLQATGQSSMIGRVIVWVLVRELAPALVALVLVGRSGAATLIRLTQMREGGQLRALDGQGIDPFLLLVVPRTLAFVVAMFTLSILFVATTMVSGFASATLIGATQISDTVGMMGVGDFAILPAKSVTIGLAIGVVCCHTALSREREAASVVAIGFVRAAMAVFAISGVVSLAT
jgi:phospholipid/cholesterol/gamma-HCH transport system permease protein